MTNIPFGPNGSKIVDHKTYAVRVVHRDSDGITKMTVNAFRFHGGFLVLTTDDKIFAIPADLIHQVEIEL